MSGTKERIVNMTVKIMSEHGVKAVRMDDIAQALGISKRTIYELYGDKETLLTEALREFHRINHQIMDHVTAGATNIIEEFIMMLNFWDKQADSNYNIAIGVKRYYPKLYNKITSEHYEEFHYSFREKMKKAMDDGYILADVNIDLAISIFTNSLYGIIKEDSILPRNVSEREAFKYVAIYFFRGIATRKGIDLIDQHIRPTTEN